jgi:nucleotide-binding universal stress UspA family protein
MREGPIVVGVDESAESMHALAKMVELASADRATEGTDLVVVFVRSRGWMAGVAPQAQVEMVTALDEMQHDVERKVQGAMEGSPLAWKFVVREGDPAHELIHEAEVQGAAGIAVGGHRHSPIGGVLVHSVEARLVHTYDGSLLIMRNPAAASSPTA